MTGPVVGGAGGIRYGQNGRRPPTRYLAQQLGRADLSRSMLGDELEANDTERRIGCERHTVTTICRPERTCLRQTIPRWRPPRARVRPSHAGRFGVMSIANQTTFAPLRPTPDIAGLHPTTLRATPYRRRNRVRIRSAQWPDIGTDSHHREPIAMIAMNTTFPRPGGGIRADRYQDLGRRFELRLWDRSAGLPSLPVAACRQSIYRQTWRRFGGRQKCRPSLLLMLVHPCSLASLLEAVHLGDADPAKHQRGKVYPRCRRNVQGRAPVCSSSEAPGLGLRRSVMPTGNHEHDEVAAPRNKRFDPRIEERHLQPVPPVGSC